MKLIKLIKFIKFICYYDKSYLSGLLKLRFLIKDFGGFR